MREEEKTSCAVEERMRGAAAISGWIWATRWSGRVWDKIRIEDEGAAAMENRIKDEAARSPPRHIAASMACAPTPAHSTSTDAPVRRHGGQTEIESQSGGVLIRGGACETRGTR